ncbi:hypothetical protein ACT3S9_08035 [Pseudoalteromonas sp. AOP31-A2-14]
MSDSTTLLRISIAETCQKAFIVAESEQLLLVLSRLMQPNTSI